VTAITVLCDKVHPDLPMGSQGLSVKPETIAAFKEKQSQPEVVLWLFLLPLAIAPLLLRVLQEIKTPFLEKEVRRSRTSFSKNGVFISCLARNGC